MIDSYMLADNWRAMCFKENPQCRVINMVKLYHKYFTSKSIMFGMLFVELGLNSYQLCIHV